jgi:thioesterase domain-containing protein/acyl carrier protein
VIATAFEPTDDVARESACRDLPIGRPIANTRIYLLDSRMRPVPPGLPGELYIGGAGVARGYLGRAGETAERFTPDPFSEERGARLFRSGDLARWRNDGELEFLGRVDHQVKIQGFRVEPGEVESALVAYPGVSAAAVVARRSADGVGRLDGYVVRADAHDELVSPASIRRGLRDVLPRHMIPATVTVLGALPLTTSGKVDRHALPAPERSLVARGEASQPPRNDIERRLARLWEEVLDVHPVGIDDNFFELGGHSLLAIRLLARIEEEFGRALPLASLFVGATIEDLAERVRERTAAVPASPLVTIQAEGRGAPLFCVHPAGGIVYCFRDLAKALGTDRPFVGIQSPGLEDDSVPPTRLEDMAAAYIDVIRQVQPRGPYHLAGWSLGGLVAFEMARQLQTEGEPAATLAVLDTRAPSDTEPVISDRLRDLAREVAALDLLGDVRDENHDPAEDALVLAEFAGDVALEFGGDVRGLLQQLRALPLDQRRARLIKALKLDHVYHLEAGPDRVRRLWTVLRSNLLAAARYRPEPIAGRLTLYRAAKRADGLLSDSQMGWGRLALGGVKVHEIPGDHAGILKPPGVNRLAKLLRAEFAGSGDAP